MYYVKRGTFQILYLPPCKSWHINCVAMCWSSLCWVFWSIPMQRWRIMARVLRYLQSLQAVVVHCKWDCWTPQPCWVSSVLRSHPRISENLILIWLAHFWDPWKLTKILKLHYLIDWRSRYNLHALFELYLWCYFGVNLDYSDMDFAYSKTDLKYQPQCFDEEVQNSFGLSKILD